MDMDGFDIRKRVNRCVNNNYGFTLVELVVVLVIIAVLAGVAGPALLGYIDKTKENNTLSDAKKVYMAAQNLSEEAHNAFVNPSDKVSAAKISEITQIAFPEGTVPYTISYIDNGFNINNPTSDMYEIDKFTYTGDGHRATYTRTDGSWTVIQITD